MGVNISAPQPRPKRHWTAVLQINHGDQRLTTAKRHHELLLAHLHPDDFIGEPHGYQLAVDELNAAYDQACRELGNPG